MMIEFCISKTTLYNMIFQKMEILPVDDLDVALHNFVNKDDKTAFYSCLQYNLEETRVSDSQLDHLFPDMNQAVALMVLYYTGSILLI